MAKSIITSVKSNANLKTFYNGREAIDFLKSAQDKAEELPDIIFLDLFMPVMDGWAFLDEFKDLKRDLGKKITIYIVSSSIDPADIEKAKSISEVTDYIIKPLTAEKFKQALAHIDIA